MKDSRVAPAGLLSVHRSQRLLSALRDRIDQSTSKRDELLRAHVIEREAEEVEFADRQQQTTNQCRDLRRQTLDQWDASEEKLTAHYENQSVTGRTELNRIAVLFRRKRSEEEQNIQRKVDARHQAVLQQYENRKNQPGQQQRKEIKQIDESLRKVEQEIQWARELTVRRLDGLPDLGLPELGRSRGLAEKYGEAKPESVRHTTDAVARLTSRCEKVIAQMQSGAASKTVDSFYLPIGVAVFIVIWGIAAIAIGPDRKYLWAAAGIIPAGIIGFSIYLILLLPLKRMTRRLYPEAEGIRHAAHEVAEAGRDYSRRFAANASKELVERRDAHIAAAKRWQTEQLTDLDARIKQEEAAQRQSLIGQIQKIDQEYQANVATVEREMRGRADRAADSITDQIRQSEQSIQELREQRAAKRQKQLQYLAQRLKAGVRSSLRRIESAGDEVDERFPQWTQLIEQSRRGDHVDYLPMGELSIGGHLRELVSGASSKSEVSSGQGSASEPVDLEFGSVGLMAPEDLPDSLPIVLHRRIHNALLIRCDKSSMEAGVDLAHQVLWRLLSGAPAGKTQLTLIDPLGRGQHFTQFMALADHDPAMVGHRVWTTDDKIEARLAEAAHHAEDVLQSSLRDRFERIEDYNVLAGSMSQPYRCVVGVGLPSGLSREGYKHLRAVVESGLRCGIFTILICDRESPWPSDMPEPTGDRVLSINLDASGQPTVLVDDLDQFPFVPASNPTDSQRVDLVERIGRDAIEAARVEIPLDQVLADVGDGQGNSDEGLSIVVGSQGANRTLSLDLGQGVRQHVLIAGKTGSGKSTLLHSIITAGAYQYRPDQLQFFLLDFKKGVEFKLYAESNLPHVRVIGIESEREFGRSVMQRLDKELQQRGELFRDAQVQELSHYREATGKAMPRIVLVVDEFQELFVRDDRIASDCAMLLDRLVRQGRSFGIHVILSSQSLAGAYSLPRATLGQMAVRIALQCSDSDAALILADDNTAARLISRPGEAIYNDASGLVEGNQPFQVAWLENSRHREILKSVAARDEQESRNMPPPVVFEGNRPTTWSSGLAQAAAEFGQKEELSGLLGESVEIGPPVAVSLSRDAGRNILLVSKDDSRATCLASVVSGFIQCVRDLELVYFDGVRVDDGEPLAPWFESAGIDAKVVKQRDCESEMISIAKTVAQRIEADDSVDHQPMIIVIDPIERFRDLRQDEAISFSLDSAGVDTGSSALQDVLRDGPSVGVWVIATCGNMETVTRWLPRKSQHDFELRILGQMNQSDSSFLIDSPAASDLSAATMLMYDSADGRVTKFRQCALPEPDDVKSWLNETAKGSLKGGQGLGPEV